VLSWKIARYGSSLVRHYPCYLQSSQRTKANEQTIESLVPRVKTLAQSLCASIPEGDVKEEGRRRRLQR